MSERTPLVVDVVAFGGGGALAPKGLGIVRRKKYAKNGPRDDSVISHDFMSPKKLPAVTSKATKSNFAPQQLKGQ